MASNSSMRPCFQPYFSYYHMIPPLVHLASHFMVRKPEFLTMCHCVTALPSYVYVRKRWLRTRGLVRDIVQVKTSSICWAVVPCRCECVCEDASVVQTCSCMCSCMCRCMCMSIECVVVWQFYNISYSNNATYSRIRQQRQWEAGRQTDWQDIQTVRDRYI